MGASLRYIKTLKHTENISVPECLNAFIFGNKLPEYYSQSTIYNKGDLILTFNIAINRFEIKECQDNLITGDYNPSKWKINLASEVITGKIPNFTLVQISDIKPVDITNLIWIQPTNIIDTSSSESGIINIKQVDGTYKNILPINTTDEVIYDTDKTLTNKLIDVDTQMMDDRNTIIDDILTVITQVSPYLTKPLQLNHIYVDDLITTSNINLISGGSEVGRLFI